MKNDVTKEKQSQFKEEMKIWFSYNHQIIPTVLALIGSVILTCTMPTHIKAIYTIFKEIVGFYMFVIMMAAVIHIFAAYNFTKKRSLVSFIYYTLLTIINLIFVILYCVLIIRERNQLGLEITKLQTKSITYMIYGSIAYIIGNIYAGFIINWQYKKIIE